jgi:hypothetical protein
MYTAEDSWEKFFQDVTAFSLQPIGGIAGMLQINWFNSSTTPIGQCNAVAGGIGLVQATGGPGKWQHT